MRIDLSLAFPGAELALEGHVEPGEREGSSPALLPARGHCGRAERGCGSSFTAALGRGCFVGPPSRETPRGPMSPREGGSELLLPPAPLPAVTHRSVALRSPFSFNLLVFALLATQENVATFFFFFF